MPKGSRAACAWLKLKDVHWQTRNFQEIPNSRSPDSRFGQSGQVRSGQVYYSAEVTV
jgi:hypothetical protein